MPPMAKPATAQGANDSLVEQRVHVVGVVFQACGRHVGRLAVAAQVGAQHGKVLRHDRGERVEQGQVHADRMQQQDVRAAAVDAMIEFYCHDQPLVEDTDDEAGLLLMMTDIDPANEADFNRWYEEEHLAERMAIPGFISARRFTALEGGPKYLALYDLESPEVLQSAPYRHIVGAGKVGMDQADGKPVHQLPPQRVCGADARGSGDAPLSFRGAGIRLHASPTKQSTPPAAAWIRIVSPACTG